MSEATDINAFELWLVEQGLREGSARAYSRDVSGFLASTAGLGDACLTRQAVSGWLDALAQAGNAPTTVARCLTSLRRYCQWLGTRRVLLVDPTKDVAVPVPQPSPVQRRRRDVEAVLVAPDPYSALGMRDRAIMVLLADTGMELQELCALNYRDWSHDGERLLVGSGRRLRTVFLYSARLPLFRYSCYVRRDRPGEALFLSNRGTRISERSVQHRVRHYAVAEGVTVSVNDLIERGRVKRSLGHPEEVARTLGFARPDAAQRRYGPPSRVPAPASAANACDHPRLRPLEGMQPGGMPSASGGASRAGSLSDTWERLESEAGKIMRLPRRAPAPWPADAQWEDTSPGDRLRSRVGPMAALLRSITQDLALLPSVAKLPHDDVVRATWASDTGLLRLNALAREASPALDMWSRLVRSLPEYSEAVGLGPETLNPGLQEPAELEAPLVTVAFHRPEHAIDLADRLLRTEIGQHVFLTLLRTQRESLLHLHQCAVEYYQLPGSAPALVEQETALAISAIAALMLCEPRAVDRGKVSDAVETPALAYFLDVATVLFHQLLRAAGQFGQEPGVGAIADDALFIERFEAEWDRLLPFTNSFFGFVVVPRLSYDDMVRYHRLCYRPHGRLDSIPYEVGDYIVHRAKGSMHFLRPMARRPVQDAFLDYVRPLYDKLLDSFEYKARGALTRQHQDQDGEVVFERADRETEAAFREAYDGYDFYQHPPGGPQTTVTEGLLGWRRRSDIRELAAELGIDCEQARTPFSAYARGHLHRLLKRLQRQSNDGMPRGLRVQAPDGRYYYTVNKMAVVFKRGVHSLRGLDDLLQPLRVSEVFGNHAMGRQGLPGCARLYIADGGNLETYRALLSEQHPRLETEGLRTETQVARWLDVDVWWLRNRRERGLLMAGRSGHFVVYNAEQRMAAGRLLEHERGMPEET